MKFYPQIKSLLLDSLINSLQDGIESSWIKNTNYLISTQIVSGTGKYISLESGKSGIYQPTHTHGIKSDGGIKWLFVEPYTNTDTYLKNLYLSIGHTSAWPNENSPPEPIINDSTRNTIVDDILTLQKIYSNDLAFGILKNDWVANTLYNKYDNTQPITNTYVTVKQTDGSISIYRCIDNNNNSLSVNKPTTKDTNNNQVTNDKYIWKFLTNIDYTTCAKFETATHYPIRYKKPINNHKDSISTLNLIQQKGDFDPLNTGSNIQFSIKQTSLSGSGLQLTANISHIITSLRVTNGGINYEPTSYIMIYPKNSPGTNADITPLITNGSITDFTINNNGINYTDLTILIIGDGTGAVAHAQITNGSITNIIIDNPGS
uniref:hypothetical protein n=1 Tax=Flavobacterium sp. TaxID=239 RepID=UPI00262FAC3F